MSLIAALLVLAGAPVSAAPGVSTSLAEAAHALEAGRVEQARLMIGAAVAEGAAGDRLDRLLADLALARGEDSEAFAAYQLLLKRNPSDPQLFERAGIAALRSDQPEWATILLDKAVAAPAAGWRAWNARGSLADRSGDWALADRCYAAAVRLAPERMEPLNNRGWSLLLRGRPAEAISWLEHAAALAPEQQRISDNLELARTAAAADLPSRRPGEADEAYAARLNDAGVVADRNGQRDRARAAFARAIEARPDYYLRAANNLARLGPPPP
ncbi:tetratricopeptide repeat protein [Sphingomonas ginkgonis]|uniref:Tetratricopeptide repeat protein n=1 Tax=Sphingomonas ginkgonis TaxID=2315330 RepID=A0A429V6V6_9SPHN|nr:tetratricopeptide repeat protein [Sphingomonas ginkgonis]RST29691.1 tetratricopeptide repeat protein [Sphingomonas ginkgonis]